MAHRKANVRKTAAVHRNRLQLDRNVRTHTLTRAELGLEGQGSYTFTDVFTAQWASTPVDATISVTLPPHFVRVLKLLRSDTPAVPPALVATVPPTGNAGEMLASVGVHARGLAASSKAQSNSLTIHGAVFTKYAPGAKRRPEATTP
jgi:hypothetical protein